MSDILDELPNIRHLLNTLPLFTAHGGLAQGDFAPSRIEFETRFVMTPNAKRLQIYDGWNDHRAALLADGLTPDSRQLLNGSYTTAKGEPGDVDLAVEIPITSSQPPPRPDQPVVRLLLGPRMKPRFNCDAYPIYVLPVNHADYQRITVAAVRYWTKWFGTDRLGNPKGRVWTATAGMI